MLMLSKIKKALKKNNDECVYIDKDKELQNALMKFKKSEILKDEASKLREEAKEIFKERLLKLNITRACNKDYMLILKEVESNRFDTTNFKKDHRDIYDMYIKPVSSLRMSIDTYVEPN